MMLFTEGDVVVWIAAATCTSTLLSTQAPSLQTVLGLDFVSAARSSLVILTFADDEPSIAAAVVVLVIIELRGVGRRELRKSIKNTNATISSLLP
jgi:hypothetical protein